MSVRVTTSDHKSGYGVLGLKAAIARALPPGALFEPELTEDGILYRFVGIAGKNADVGKPDLPSWARGEDKT